MTVKAQKHFLFLFLLLCQLYKAQYPQHFNYDNNNGLPSNEVYSILMDQKGFLWLGCDAGLYKFDGVRYLPFKCASQKSRSVSGLCRSTSGRLYCYNFQSQLFFLENDSLKEVKHNFSKISNIACNQKGELLVNHQDGLAVFSERTQNCRNFSGFGKDNSLTWKHYTRSVKVSSTGEAYFLNTSGIGIYSNGRLRVIENNLFRTEAVGSFLLEIIGNTVWIFSLSKNKVYTCDEKSTEEFESKKLSEALRDKKITNLKLLDDGKLWICTYSGVIRYDTQSDSVSILYPNLSFSDCLLDREGNYWFSTLQSGLIRVANLEYIVWDDFDQKRLTKIKVGGGFIYFSTVNGSIGRLDRRTNDLKLFNTGSNADIQSLNYEESENCLYFFTNTDLYRLKDGIIRRVLKSAPSTKCVKKIKSQFLLCSSFGAYLFDLNTKKEILKLNSHWTRKAEYDAKKEMVWLAGNEGLLSYRTERTEWRPAESYFPKTQIISIDLDTVLHRIFVLSFNGKVHSIAGNSQPSLLATLPEDIQCYNLKQYNNNIYLATNKGLIWFNIHDKNLQVLNLLSGLTSENVRDLCISDDHIFLATGQGLQKIPLHGSSQKHSSTIYVKNTFAADSTFRLDYRQPLTVLPEVNAHSSNGRFKYAYRIKNSDNKWIEFPGTIEEINIQNLPPGNFEIELKAIDYLGFDTENTILLKGYVTPPFWMSWWFILLSILLFLFLVYLAFKIQLTRRQKELKRQSELNASKLTALRSQMNPHFIFNALNSIQDLILKGDVENSYSYLTTFSNMVRKTLDFSDKDLIDFEHELKLTGLYLRLEKLRFKADFTYTIDTGNVEDILIPPLLVQPFIENALVHGLLHKEGERRLSIRFELKEHLICIIEDNGIGRDRTRTIRHRQGSDHESFSGKAIEKRFAILSDVFKGKFGYKYHDLKSDGEAVGTKVVLYIPVKRKF